MAKSVERNFVNNKYMICIRCRLCNMLINKTEGHSLVESKNKLTDLGEKLYFIINSDISNTKTLPKYCCPACKNKIEDCFRFIKDIRAASQTIANLYNSTLVSYNSTTPHDKNNIKLENIFYCPDCFQECNNFLEFSDHYGLHLQQSTRKSSVIEDDEKDLKTYSRKETKFKSSPSDDHLYCTKNLQSSKDFKPTVFEIRVDREEVVKTTAFEYEPKAEIEALSDDTEEQISDQDVEKTNDVTLDTLNERISFTRKRKRRWSKQKSDLSPSMNHSITAEPGFKIDPKLEDLLGEEPFDIPYKRTGLVYDCAHCETTMTRKSLMRQHILSSHGHNIELVKHRTCRLCSNSFSIKEYLAHYVRCKKISLDKRIYDLCHLCGKNIMKLRWAAHMQKHRELNKGSQTCKVCFKVFKTRWTLSTHMALHDESKKVMCEICGAKMSQQALYKHTRVHHHEKKPCHVCGKGFPFEYLLEAHIKTHQRIVDSNPELTFSLDGNNFKCLICQQEFSLYQSLDLHMKMNHNNLFDANYPYYKCGDCDKLFSDFYSLRNHLRLVHDLDAIQCKRVLKSIPCHTCNKMFASEGGLKTHLRRRHTTVGSDVKKQKMECEVCGNQFRSKYNLANHIKSVHMKLKYKDCKLCGSSYSTQQGYDSHMLSHNGEKPFQCEVCYKSYRENSDVMRHLKLHVDRGEAPIETASARNNRESARIRKRRIFLKDSVFASRPAKTRVEEVTTSVLPVCKATLCTRPS